MQEWFWLPKDEVLSGLRTGEEGLDAGEAKARLCEYGENVILERKKTPWWQVFLGQFKDLLVMILIGAAARWAISRVIPSALLTERNSFTK